jgi:hypothetical protein
MSGLTLRQAAQKVILANRLIKAFSQYKDLPALIEDAPRRENAKATFAGHTITEEQLKPINGVNYHVRRYTELSNAQRLAIRALGALAWVGGTSALTTTPTATPTAAPGERFDASSIITFVTLGVVGTFIGVGVAVATGHQIYTLINAYRNAPERQRLLSNDGPYQDPFASSPPPSSAPEPQEGADDVLGDAQENVVVSVNADNIV